jgi:hypothetical protein
LSQPLSLMMIDRVFDLVQQIVSLVKIGAVAVVESDGTRPKLAIAALDEIEANYRTWELYEVSSTA